MMNRIALIVTAACLLAIGNQAIAQKKAERYSVTEREKGISENATVKNYNENHPNEKNIFNYSIRFIHMLIWLCHMGI